MTLMPMNGSRSLAAISIVNGMEGWASLRHVSKSVASERSRTRASVSSMQQTRMFDFRNAVY